MMAKSKARTTKLIDLHTKCLQRFLSAIQVHTFNIVSCEDLPSNHKQTQVRKESLEDVKSREAMLLVQMLQCY